ncbi:homeobox protein Hox-B3-like [Durio zibethinus]|uniref:Homeobox protein Hox-B3-like n=1 Tax=Durio zibethinus TaxID=66656 RepID=A0A6P5ZN14_DURZI|nr:homeobox protein Hox-B3-like [Durio zibethinus]XP_022753927.1 homeobox protein Hox-B3-like [Durio zibethinus]
MEDRYSFSRQGSGVWRSLRNGDFEEEDVWAVLKERQDSTSKVGQSIESYVPVRRDLPSAARMIPKTFSVANNSSNIGSSASSSGHEANGVKQQSAPVNIPDWSKISSNKSKKVSCRNGSWHDDDGGGGGGGGGGDDGDGVMNGFGHSDDEEDHYDEYDSKVPPHEFLARRLARSQISSFSVFEGVGRKLKGRDLRKVRNAVLTKTGFLE